MSQEYQMHFARPDGELGLTLFFAADDDGAATVQASSELEAHASFSAVELLRDARLVARIQRPSDTVVPV
ncbi:hypothetical protein ACETK8_18370 [Brevundimonas staleyi]|uniref:DUF1488 family protein n=1 Tax=Brevundimonas staleyi TaxID=74326 RepID=A0ABW0FSW7_9CAUL